MIKKIVAVVKSFSAKFLEGNKLFGILIAGFSVLLVIAFSFTDLYKTFELTLLDLRFNIKPPSEPWERLSIIDIDENSITSVGEYPWSRDIYGLGLDVLDELNVFQTSIDIIFTDESPYRVNLESINNLKKKNAIKPEDLDSIIINHDMTFAQKIKKSDRAIISYPFNNELPDSEAQERQTLPDFVLARERFEKIASIKISDDEKSKYDSLIDPKIKSISYPIPLIMNTGRNFGFVDNDPDIDGTIRRIRLLRFHNGRIYFNLSLAMLIDMCKVKHENILIDPGSRITLKKAFNPATNTFTDISIPIDDEGMMIINWAGKWDESFNIIPFQVLLNYNEYYDIVESAYNFFSEMESSGEQKGESLAVSFEKLNHNIENYKKSVKSADKKKYWNNIVNIQKSIIKNEKKYAAVKLNEIKALKKEYEKSKDEMIKNEIAHEENIYDMIHLIIKLQGIATHIATVGVTATAAGDIDTIPLQNFYPRAGIYPNVVNTILKGDYIRRIPVIVNFCLMLIIALALGFLFQMLDARKSLILMGITFFALNIIIILLFALGNVWFDQFGISLAVLLPSLSIIALKFINEESQKRYIKGAFSRYLSSEVIDEIMENPDLLQLGGENRVITTYFSDIASFSAISERLSPAGLVNLLNEYLSEMTDIILSHRGTVDKFIGDAIMAFYGAPQSYKDHAYHACMAAIEMKKRLREMQEFWRKHGRDELSVRMGINTGDAVVGNMGSKSRMDYTAMGDSVNLASRLEGANKYYRTFAMISESTYNETRDHIDVRHLDIIRVIGKTEAISIYELLGQKGSLPDKIYDMLDKYNNGMEYFQKRDWKEAQKYFKQGLKIVKDDGPCITYIERCEEYMKKPPSKKWDGVYSLKSK